MKILFWKKIKKSRCESDGSFFIGNNNFVFLFRQNIKGYSK